MEFTGPSAANIVFQLPTSSRIPEDEGHEDHCETSRQKPPKEENHMFACPICGKTFASRQGVAGHKKAHTMEISLSESEVSGQTSASLGPSTTLQTPQYPSNNYYCYYYYSLHVPAAAATTTTTSPTIATFVRSSPHGHHSLGVRRDYYMIQRPPNQLTTRLPPTYLWNSWPYQRPSLCPQYYLPAAVDYYKPQQPATTSILQQQQAHRQMQGYNNAEQQLPSTCAARSTEVQDHGQEEEQELDLTLKL